MLCTGTIVPVTKGESGRLTKGAGALLVVSCRASTPRTALVIEPTGTRVPVTRGERGRLTIGHWLVVVTVLSGSAAV